MRSHPVSLKPVTKGQSNVIKIGGGHERSKPPTSSFTSFDTMLHFTLRKLNSLEKLRRRTGQLKQIPIYSSFTSILTRKQVCCFLLHPSIEKSCTTCTRQGSKILLNVEYIPYSLQAPVIHLWQLVNVQIGVQKTRNSLLVHLKKAESC
jgi:hypothetical protein